jgi:archaellum component FlaC
MGREINRARYTGLDFDTIEDDLRARLQIQFAADFNDFAVSSLGILLMDMVSFGLDGFSFFLDRRASDSYLVTARTRKSVSKLTRQIGYKMGAAVASSVDLQVSLAEVKGFAVPVPSGFQFAGPNGLIFEAAESVTFAPGDGPSDFQIVPCFEGETITETFVSDGTALQEFELARVPDDKFIVQGSATVTVDGAEWEEAEFIAFDETDQYEINFNGEPPTITFGDGVAGNVPTTGATINVTYVASRGKAGLVNQNTIQGVVTPLVVAFQEIGLVIDNPLGSVAGDDPETISSAKINGPKVFKTRGAAVTREDYESLANAFSDPLFGRVAVAHAFTARSAAADLVVQSATIAIEGASIQPLAVVDTEAPAIEADMDAIDAAVAEIDQNRTDIAALTAAADADLVTAIDAARDAKNRADEIGADTGGISTKVTDGKAFVDGITTGGSSTLTTADKDSIKTFFDRINTENGSISGAASSLKGSVESQITGMGSARDALADIGLTDTEEELGQIQAQTQSISAEVLTTRASVDSIEATIQDTRTEVSNQTTVINEHFDKILSDDCKSNVVIVPILARDASGFFAAPSLGLINALEQFLEARKEVTQTVEVVSGEDFLIRAVVTVRIGVIPGNAESTVLAAVATAVDNLLRDRRFGRSLFRSNIIDVATLVEGVSFIDATVNGSLDRDDNLVTDKLDTLGNLLVEDTEVITKGTVTLSTVLDEEAS